MKGPEPPPDAGPAPWWETRWLVAALALLSAVPLLWPEIPPLVDLPGHMGRYRVQLDMGTGSPLERFFAFDWALIGNLGIDLLVMPLAPLLGLEGAVKLVVVMIPVLTAAGFLWVAREVHGRVPPSALFAVPIAYNYPLIFGFANFALSMALAFLAFALWLRLARLGRTRLRAALFVPLSFLLWLTHAFGWGTLGVMAFSAEFVRQWDAGHRAPRAAIRAAIHAAALAGPFILMLLWRGNSAGETGDWFNMPVKALWFAMALRDRWMAFDLAALGVLLLLLFAAMRSPRIEYSRNLAASAIMLLIVYLCLPRIVFGSAYADMRLIPYVLALAVVAIRLRAGAGPRLARGLAIGGLAFIAVRTAATTLSFAHYAARFDGELEAMDHLPAGARVAAFVGKPCESGWATSRLDHLPGLAIVRRRAFANDQWAMAGAQLLRVDYPAGGRFVGDPSQLVLPPGCPHPLWLSLDDSLRMLPRGAFDYVWLIDPPAHDPRLTAGMRPVWRRGTSALYALR